MVLLGRGGVVLVIWRRVQAAEWPALRMSSQAKNILMLLCRGGKAFRRTSTEWKPREGIVATGCRRPIQWTKHRHSFYNFYGGGVMTRSKLNRMVIFLSPVLYWHTSIISMAVEVWRFFVSFFCVCSVCIYMPGVQCWLLISGLLPRDHGPRDYMDQSAVRVSSSVNQSKSINLPHRYV